jgi:hypothetical protein
MVVERSANEFIIRMPLVTQIERVQEIADYMRYIELTSGYKTSQEVVDEFARDVNRSWRKQYENSH